MRTLPILLASTIFIPSAFADDADRIEWDPGRKLTLEDFAASVPPSEDPKRIAATTASILWSYSFSVRRSRSDCTYTITVIDSAAYFHRDASWVHADHRNSAVLQHEQGHFDIAHVYSQQFEAETRKLLGYQDECRGRSRREATRYSELAIAELVGAVYDEIWAAYRSRQQAYDGATGHGTDAEAQARWSDCIATMLTGARTTTC